MSLNEPRNRYVGLRAFVTPETYVWLDGQDIVGVLFRIIAGTEHHENFGDYTLENIHSVIIVMTK
jgi:hypothetical protein